MHDRPALRWWRELDSILRRTSLGRTTLEQSIRRLLIAILLTGALYGSFIGWYAVKTRGWAGLPQVLSAAAKVPLLFLLTLAVTFPSLAMFASLLNAPLGFRQTLRLLLTAILVTLLSAASFGPILGFFTVSTESYHFMLVLNVALLGAAGVIGVSFLVLRMESAEAEALSPEPPDTRADDPAGAATPPPPDAEPPHSPRVAEFLHSREEPPPRGLMRGSPRGSTILQAWIIIYALVGLQMAWILRPFVANPDAPLTLFRPSGGNFFESFLSTLRQLLWG